MEWRVKPSQKLWETRLLTAIPVQETRVKILTRAIYLKGFRWVDENAIDCSPLETDRK